MEGVEPVDSSKGDRMRLRDIEQTLESLKGSVTFDGGYRMWWRPSVTTVPSIEVELIICTERLGDGETFIEENIHELPLILLKAFLELKEEFNRWCEGTYNFTLPLSCYSQETIKQQDDEQTAWLAQERAKQEALKASVATVPVEASAPSS
jgi:hypothetical protein